MSDKMTDWYILGNHWTLCRNVNNRAGQVTVETYDGRTLTGRARKGLYGWLVDAQ